MLKSMAPNGCLVFFPITLLLLAGSLVKSQLADKELPEYEPGIEDDDFTTARPTTIFRRLITNDNRPSAEASNCRCTTHLNYCGKSLGSFCSGGTRRSFESDSLYGCSVDHSPVKIRACSGGCQLKKVSENDVCSQPSVSAYAPDKDYLASGGKLLRGQTIWSTSKQTKLVLQHDGNLVVYRVASEAENSSDKPKWASGTNVLVGTPESVHLLQGGDLVMGNKAGSVVWRLGTEFEGASLRVLDENGGKVCLVTSRTDSECLWSS